MFPVDGVPLTCLSIDQTALLSQNELAALKLWSEIAKFPVAKSQAFWLGGCVKESVQVILEL